MKWSLTSEGLYGSLGPAALEGVMSELGLMSGDSRLQSQPCLSLALWFKLSVPQFPSLSHKDNSE